MRTTTRTVIARGIDAAADWWRAKHAGDSRAQRNASRRLGRAVDSIAATQQLDSPLQKMHIGVGLRALGKAIAEDGGRR